MVQFKHKVKLNYLGWLANPILNIIILGKQSEEFLENLGRLVINYLLPEMLVTYNKLFSARIQIKPVTTFLITFGAHMNTLCQSEHSWVIEWWCVWRFLEKGGRGGYAIGKDQMRLEIYNNHGKTWIYYDSCDVCALCSTCNC